MKMALQRTSTRRLLCLLLCANLAFTNCTKEENNPEPPVVVSTSLTVSAIEAAPYQYIRVNLPAGAKPVSTTATSVNIKVGDSTVVAYTDSKVVAAGEYAYYLLLPELAPGSYKIAVAVADGKTAEGSIKLTAFTKVTDVTNYIKTQQTAAQLDIDNAVKQYDAQVQAGHMRPATRDSLRILFQQAFDQNKTTIDGLSDADKRIYVQLLEANKAWLTSFKQVFKDNPLSTYKVAAEGNCEELRRQQKEKESIGAVTAANNLRIQADQCEAERAQKRVEASSEFSKKMKEAYEAANEERKATPGRLRAGWAFVSTFFTEAAKGLAETATGLQDLNDPFAVFKIEDTKDQRTTAQEYEVDKEYNYSVGLQLVNLNSQNTNTFPVFGTVIQNINNYNTTMNGMSQLPFATQQLKVPDSKIEKLYVSGFTIDQVSDSRVKVELTNGTKGSVVKFTLVTPIVEEKINFTFRVNYASQFGSGSLQVPVTLVIPLSKMLTKVGSFKFTQWVEGGVDLFTMHEIHRWKCGQTEYINKEQLLDASISFSADDKCTVTEKYHEMYYDNPGTTCATVRFVDQQKSYSSVSSWLANNTTKALTITFKDELGQEHTMTSTAVIQNGTLTVSAGGVTMSMQKK